MGAAVDTSSVSQHRRRAHRAVHAGYKPLEGGEGAASLDASQRKGKASRGNWAAALAIFTGVVVATVFALKVTASWKSEASVPAGARPVARPAPASNLYRAAVPSTHRSTPNGLVKQEVWNTEFTNKQGQYQQYAADDTSTWKPAFLGHASGRPWRYPKGVVAGTHYMNQPQKLEAILTSNHMLTVAEDRVAWLKINKSAEYEDVLVSSGEGIYLSAVQGELLDNTWTTLWLLVRTTPSNGAKLVHVVSVGPYTGTVLEEVDLPLTSPISMMRYENYIFVASESGNVLHIHYPDMTIKGAYRFVSSDGGVVSAVHPLSDNMFWAILNNNGKSEVVSVVIWDGVASDIGRRELVGNEYTDLLRWEDGYLALDAGSGSLIALSDLDEASSTSAVSGETIWTNQNELNEVVNGFSVVNDIAFIGVNRLDESEDATEVAEVLFFDLLNRVELGRAPIKSSGPINAVSATHLSHKSCYESIGINSDLLLPLAIKGAETKPYQMMLGTHVDVQPVLDVLEQIKADVGDEYGPYGIWMIEGQQTNAFNDGSWYSDNDKAKPGVLSIVLMFSSLRCDMMYKFPWWSKYFEPVLQPILDQIFEPVFGKGNVNSKYMRMQLALIQPDVTEIKEHWDMPFYSTMGHRVHIPITWNDGVRFALGGKNLTAHLGVGDAFEVDNAVSHGVVNLGSSDRIHLVVDVLDDPVDNYFMLTPGQKCALKDNDCGSLPQ